VLDAGRAKELKRELAFLSAISALLRKFDGVDKKRSAEQKDSALKQVALTAWWAQANRIGMLATNVGAGQASMQKSLRTWREFSCRVLRGRRAGVYAVTSYF